MAGWVLAAACISAWVAGGAGGWRAGAGALALLVAGAIAARAWWRTPSGRLAWDGTAWWFQAARQPGIAGHVTVALDLQGLLLVRWQGTRRHWFWLERARSPAHWDDLRRAVYSRPDDDARPAPRCRRTFHDHA